MTDFHCSPLADTIGSAKQKTMKTIIPKQRNKAAMTSPITPAEISENVAATAYDLSAWHKQVRKYASIKSACARGLRTDGIHQISITKDQTLDVCMQDLALLEANGRERVILVGLSGAVANRCGKKAPFFAGLGVARSLRLPVIAVSDPTLALDANLPLAWFAGNADNPNAATILAKALDAVAKHHRARLIIFGGSGGGYAGLVLATLLECRATVVVWNPQTAIADYVPQFVHEYIQVAFPGLKKKSSDLKADAEKNSTQSDAQSQGLRQLLEKAGVIHDVRGVKQKSLTDILYLQNRSDWHVAKHAAPYLAGKSLQRVGNASFVEQTQNQIGILFGQWGEGHVPLPNAIIDDVLKNLARGVPMVDVLRALDRGIPDLSESAPFFFCAAADPDFRPEINTRIEAGKVLITCSVGHPEQSSFGVTYAFYLLLNGERVAVRWYTVDNHVTFDLPPTPGRLEVVAFVLDSLANKVITRVPVPATVAGLRT
jgi:pimeloyl-ACP methyl ester carboxylesterase